MSKSYSIKTTNDILKAVNSKNIDGFLKDFESWLRLTIETKETIVDNPFLEFAESSFTWNDDGEYGKIKSTNITIENKL